MDKKFSYYAVHFSKSANKFMRIALPCLKQLDKHTRAKACVEKKPGETRDQWLWRSDAIAAAINQGLDAAKQMFFGPPARPEKSDPGLTKILSEADSR